MSTQFGINASPQRSDTALRFEVLPDSCRKVSWYMNNTMEKTLPQFSTLIKISAITGKEILIDIQHSFRVGIQR